MKGLVGVLEREKKDLASLNAGDKEHIKKLEDQVRDTMKKVKDARAHANQKVVECGSLRNTQVELQQQLSKLERQLSSDKVVAESLKKENIVLKEQLLESNETCKEYEIMCQEFRAERNVLRDQQNLHAPRLNAYEIIRKNNTEANLKLVEATKRLNLLTGEFKLLQDRLAMEKKDTTYLRKELNEMEKALHSSAQMINATAYKKASSEDVDKMVRDAYSLQESQIVGKPTLHDGRSHPAKKSITTTQHEEHIRSLPKKTRSIHKLLKMDKCLMLGWKMIYSS